MSRELLLTLCEEFEVELDTDQRPQTFGDQLRFKLNAYVHHKKSEV